MALTAIFVRFSRVSTNALADGLVVGGVAEGVHPTTLGSAWIVASFRLQVAVFMVRTVVVGFAVGDRLSDAVAFRVQTISILQMAGAVAALIDDKTSFQRADTSSALIDAQPLLSAARDAVVVVVGRSVGRTYTFSHCIDHVAFVTVAIHSYYRCSYKKNPCMGSWSRLIK